VMDDNKTKRQVAKIRGIHPYSFRTGEWATIIGALLCTPVGLEPRMCYKCLYPDGVIDYVPVDEPGEIEAQLGWSSGGTT